MSDMGLELFTINPTVISMLRSVKPFKAPPIEP